MLGYFSYSTTVRENEMDKLKDVCDLVDDFVKEGTSMKFESSDDFWKKLSKDPALAQM